MTAITNPRAHLVERAAAAMGSPGGLALAGGSMPPGGLPPQAGAPASDHLHPRGQASPPTGPQPSSPRDAIAENLLAGAGLIGAADQRSRLVEEVMVVQHQILRTVQETPPTGTRNPRLVLVTSALPGEGKSFCALNVAAGIASASGRPATVVDVDGKPGSLTALLDCTAERGLRTLVTEPSVPPASLVLRTARPGLSFLPYGVPSPGASATPSGAAIAAAMLRLAAAMPGQVLVLDTPPCLSTSEASLLAPVVGQVVMVVQAERAQRGEVEAALDMLESCPALQLLLNRMQLATSETFASQDYGPYGDANAA